MVQRATPISVPAGDEARVYEAWRRVQILDGTWRELLREHVEQQLGPLRARLVGEPDTSANLFSSVIDQTTTIYDEPPQLKGDAGVIRVLDQALDAGGWWAIARQHAIYTKGCVDSAVYVGWDDVAGHPTFELAPPSRMTIEMASRSRVGVVWYSRQRRVPHKPDEVAWYWDRWDVADPTKPSMTVWTNDRRQDVTGDHIDDPLAWRGARYPYRELDGRPVVPFVLYHSQGPIGSPFHPNARAEVVFGTLQIGLLWTAAVHGYLRASWDQRVLVNGKVRGGTVDKAEDGRPAVRLLTPDPTRILQVDGEGASIAAWGASIDIEKAERFVRLYESRLAVHFGMSPADVVIESLNPASGASIVVSQAGKRLIAARDRVNFSRGDRALFRLVAALYRAHGERIDANGVTARYRGVALTIQERRDLVPTLAQELELGLVDDVGAYQELHPGTTRQDAIDDLEVIRRRRQQLEDEQRRSASVEQRRAQALDAVARLRLVEGDEPDDATDEQQPA